ncbi:hypothetical protein EDC01DRAFT_754298 [Geopyxis carbonaria]|nr:hypothetical protein EDC01DRAFT_754298 [Geopyxis carbonaria]
MAHQRTPHLGGGSAHLYGPPPSNKPRTRTHDELELELLREEDDDQDVEPHYQHLPPPQQHPSHHLRHHALPQQSHHHHHLPDQPPPAKIARTGPQMGLGSMSPGMGMGGPSGGPPGGPPGGPSGPSGSVQVMPSPAPRPKGPKLKFTPEDDTLLVDLKENKALTWKQIADFFPGRSSGTLQVRYCTKLKAKTIQWTDESVQRLRSAMQEYEQDRWRLIAAKVGNGFSAAACREKAKEFDDSEGNPGPGPPLL